MNLASRPLALSSYLADIREGGDVYTFDVFDREHVRIRINGNREVKSNVPDPIQQEVDQYIPASADYIRT